VQALLTAAECIKRSRPQDTSTSSRCSQLNSDHGAVSLSKDELEQTAKQFRRDLGVTDDEPLDSLKLDVEGIEIINVTETNCLDASTVRRLSTEACDEWSAMSVPLDEINDQWAVLLNNCHTIERQRVTVLEEIWHILLGHKLTRIAKIAEAYGRTYDSVEEHDAYYLASATLLPKKAVVEAVAKRQSASEMASRFGTSPELVDYRIKRLGLWRDHIGKKVALASE
jgi:hypothetical protein